MKSVKRHRTLLLALFGLAMLCLAMWNIRWMLAQRSAAQQEARDLAQCRALEQVLQEMRRQTTLVSARELETQELGLRIDDAAKQAQLNATALDGVFPQAAQRVANLPYMQKPTALVLRKVELRPLTTFLYNLTNTPGLTVRDLRLRAPRGEAVSTSWDVDATITCLIYAPDNIAPVRGD